MQAAAPFAVRASAAGYASATGADESARGEQWMPLWDSPTTWPAFERLINEARLLSGRSQAGTPLDAALALSRAGVARGISSFQRYGFIERNGQSNLAVPLGAWQVRQRPAVALVDSIDGWVAALKRAGDAKGAPVSVSRRARQLESAIFDVLAQPTVERVEGLLVRLAEAEEAIVRSGRWAAEQHLRPLPSIPEEAVAAWLPAEEPEVEIARALAALDAPGGYSLRWNCVPLDNRGERFAAGGAGLSHSPDLVWSSARLAWSLAAIIVRRVNDARGAGFPFLPGRFSVGLDATSRFIAGELDDVRIARLARGLMSVRWTSRADGQPSEARPDATFSVCRLAWAPWRPSEASARAVPDPQVPKLLARGRGNEAVSAGLRRLASWGLRARVDPSRHHLQLDGNRARRFAAALLFPMRSRDLDFLATSLRRQPNEVISA